MSDTETDDLSWLTPVRGMASTTEKMLLWHINRINTTTYSSAASKLADLSKLQALYDQVMVGTAPLLNTINFLEMLRVYKVEERRRLGEMGPEEGGNEAIQLFLDHGRMLEKIRGAIEEMVKKAEGDETWMMEVRLAGLDDNVVVELV